MSVSSLLSFGHAVSFWSSAAAHGFAPVGSAAPSRFVSLRAALGRELLGSLFLFQETLLALQFFLGLLLAFITPAHEVMRISTDIQKKSAMDS